MTKDQMRELIAAKTAEYNKPIVTLHMGERRYTEAQLRQIVRGNQTVEQAIHA